MGVGVVLSACGADGAAQAASKIAPMIKIDNNANFRMVPPFIALGNTR